MISTQKISFINIKINHIMICLAVLLIMTEILNVSNLRILLIGIILFIALLGSLKVNYIILFSCLPLFNLLNLKMGSTSMYYLIILIFCLKYFYVKQHYKFIYKLIWLFILFFYVILDPTLQKLTWYLLIIPLILTYRENIFINNAKLIIQTISINTLISCLGGYILLINGNTLYAIGTVYNNGEITTRFAGLIGDSVVLGLIINILIACNLVFLYNAVDKKKSVIIIMCLSLFGFLTVSKTFIGILLFIIVIYIVYSLKKMLRKKSTLYKSIIYIFTVFITSYFIIKYCISNINMNIISNYLIRFNSQDLFTGRIEIFQHNINKITSHLLTLLLGMPINMYNEPYYMPSGQPITNAHNIYLETICLFGIIAFFIMIIAICFIIVRGLNRKISEIQLLPLIVLLIYGLILHGHLDFSYYTIVALCLLFTYPEMINKISK